MSYTRQIIEIETKTKDIIKLYSVSTIHKDLEVPNAQK